MGMDYDVLAAQIEERKQREAAEKDWNTQANAEIVRQSKIVELLANREVRDRKALNKMDVEFRSTQQLNSTKREFDLNDPTALKNAAPTRIGDIDDRLGKSSLQIFDGEDLSEKTRKALQAEQKLQWLTKQRDENREKINLEGECVTRCILPVLENFVVCFHFQLFYLAPFLSAHFMNVCCFLKFKQVDHD
jgi:RIB43A